MSNRNELSEQQQLFLVVEDDEATAEMLKEALLLDFSCVVSWASTGLEAFQRVQTIRPNLIILDYWLPGINGLELAERLHQLPGFESIPLLFMSAANNLQEIERRHLPYLEKPFSLTSLISTIRDLLEQEASHSPSSFERE